MLTTYCVAFTLSSASDDARVRSAKDLKQQAARASNNQKDMAYASASGLAPFWRVEVARTNARTKQLNFRDTRSRKAKGSIIKVPVTLLLHLLTQEEVFNQVVPQTQVASNIGCLKGKLAARSKISRSRRCRARKSKRGSRGQLLTRKWH